MVMLRWPVYGEWSCYRGGQWRENGHVTEVHLNRGRMVRQRWNLMQREWSCYGGSQYNNGGEFKGEWSCYGGGQFTGGRMVMLQRWPVMERACSCYIGGQFNEGSMVTLLRQAV